MPDKKEIRKKLVIESVIAFFLVTTPLLTYFYKYIPVSSVDSWDFFGISFSNNGFENVSTAFYYYFSKLVPLLLLIVWFVTCKRWWYHTILIPIAMYAFQAYSVLSEDISSIDENEILYLVAVCMFIIPIVYFIRIKLVDKYVHGIDLEAMEAELHALKQKQGNRDLKDPKKSDFIKPGTVDKSNPQKNESLSYK